MWEQANELAEACLEVDHDMVCTMHDLTHTMGHANMGVLSVAGAGAPGVSVGVGWSGECEEGASKEQGKGKERVVGVAWMTGLREGVTGMMMAVMRMVVMMMPLPWSI